MADTGFARPTLPELKTRIHGDMVTRLEEDEVLRRNDLTVHSTVQAGAVHGLYGYIDHAARQILPDTADAEELDRHGTARKLFRKGETAAGGKIVVSASAGTVVPVGAELRHSSGVFYKATEDVTVLDASALVPVIAQTAGIVGNRVANDALQFVSPIVGAKSLALVGPDGLGGGADPESDDAFRKRIEARWQQPPQGGADYDYEAWALEVPGVTRAWVLRHHMGLGTVGVTFVMDGRENIIPLEEDRKRVADHIETRRNVIARVFVFIPGTTPVNPRIRLNPDTPANRAAVVDQLLDFLFREGGAGKKLYLSRMGEAISQAQGEFDHTLILPAADIQLGPGYLAALGVPEWVA